MGIESFDYGEAFSRNIGWLTEAEQQVLKAKRVAIAGVGGVGGVHLLTLARLGIGQFNISDLDSFEQGNFNRQAGAYMANIGRAKVEVMAEMARGINPELDLRQFPEGVNLDNIDDFLDGVDLYIDGLDFFVLDIRRAVFKACYERGIPAITVAPLGMGAALLCFLPGQMSFEDYFCMEGQPPAERQVRFLVGLSPAMLQLSYLVDDSRVDFEAQKGPSTAMACELCAGIAATNAAKLLLQRGEVLAAPRGLHFDAYKNTLRRTWRPWGNNNPVQRLMLAVARKKLNRQLQQPATTTAEIPTTPVERILELARWAPSGDNTQPWRFEITGPQQLRVHGFDTRDWCMYDLQGHASQLALGALLETLQVAASAEGWSLSWQLLPESEAEQPRIEVQFHDQPEISPSARLPYVKVRTTQRRPLSTTRLSRWQKRALEQAVGEGYQLTWLEGRSQRWQMAKLLFRSAKIRLTTREGYEVHSRIIQWNSRYSEDRIPDRAVGLDAPSVRLMRWALKSWGRVQFLNRYLAGTWLPRLQLDLLPGFRCGAHFLLSSETPLETPEDFLRGGRALQRLWLEATRQGLQFQPEMTPLIFSQYHLQGVQFTGDAPAQQLAAEVACQLSGLFAEQSVQQGVFMGRLGLGKNPDSRSLRLPLAQLMKESSAPEQ